MLNGRAHTNGPVIAIFLEVTRSLRVRLSCETLSVFQCKQSGARGRLQTPVRISRLIPQWLSSPGGAPTGSPVSLTLSLPVNAVRKINQHRRLQLKFKSSSIRLHPVPTFWVSLTTNMLIDTRANSESRNVAPRQAAHLMNQLYLGVVDPVRCFCVSQEFRNTSSNNTVYRFNAGLRATRIS